MKMKMIVEKSREKMKKSSIFPKKNGVWVSCGNGHVRPLYIKMKIVV